MTSRLPLDTPCSFLRPGFADSMVEENLQAPAPTLVRFPNYLQWGVVFFSSFISLVHEIIGREVVISSVLAYLPLRYIIGINLRNT
jgi:hypothetical protein